MYETEDTVHYDYFDYIDIDSDMKFLEFKETMRREWAAAKKARWWPC
jgi:hypothetical protein